MGRCYIGQGQGGPIHADAFGNGLAVHHPFIDVVVLVRRGDEGDTAAMGHGNAPIFAAGHRDRAAGTSNRIGQSVIRIHQLKERLDLIA